MTKVSEQRKHDILIAASEEFRKKGIDGASMSEIASRAGIGKSTIYEYFPSKTDLFIDMYTNKMNEIAEEIQVVFNQEVTFRAKIAGYCRVMLRSLEDVDMGSILTMFVNNPLSAELADHATQLWNYAESHVEQAIRQAQTEGELSSNINVTIASSWLLSLPNPHLIRYLKQQGIEQPEEQIVNYTISGLSKACPESS